MDCNHEEISVILPVKNGERFLAQALDSVLAQTIRPLEILVVVGESADRTLEIARSYADVTVLPQVGHGLAQARNLGLERSRGEFIAFLDHDDLWPADKLVRQIALLRSRPEVQYTIGYLSFKTVGNLGVRKDLGRRNVNGRLLGLTPGCLMARRGLFDAVGGFDPAYKIGCDHDWFARARDYAVPMAVLPDILLYKRLHGANLSADIQHYRQEMLHIARDSIKRKHRL